MASSRSWRSSGIARPLGSLLIALAAAGGAVADKDEALLRAVHEDRTAEAKALLAKGAEADHANRYGVRSLPLASANGNAALVQALLEAGADPNSADPGGATALMAAARSGRAEVVELLLKAGAKSDARDNQGQSALMWAAAEGHARTVELLLAAGASREVRLGSGFTAWHFAAREGQREVIDVLLVDGADVNAPIETERGGGRAPKNGTSALLLAIENGHFELADRLLEAGADPNDLRSGHGPLHVLTWVRKPRRGDGIDGAPPPRVAGAMTSLELAERLLAHGAEVNLQLGKDARGGDGVGRPGATPFLMASRTADLPLMKLLHAHGADFRLANRAGRTPLLAAAGVMLGPEADEAASEDESVAAVKYLLELGADIDVVDRNGDTVMHSAAYKQSPKLVRLFASKGADIAVWNRKNKQGRTPLLIAQGFRNGNFKPSQPTIAAMSAVMREAGVEPPPPPPRPGTKERENYGN